MFVDMSLYLLVCDQSRISNSAMNYEYTYISIELYMAIKQANIPFTEQFHLRLEIRFTHFQRSEHTFENVSVLAKV